MFYRLYLQCCLFDEREDDISVNAIILQKIITWIYKSSLYNMLICSTISLPPFPNFFKFFLTKTKVHLLCKEEKKKTYVFYPNA